MKENKLMIADFGISKILNQTLTMCQNGSPPYQAPEILNGSGCNFKSDIW
jgi:serine/threonine protein kinase